MRISVFRGDTVTERKEIPDFVTVYSTKDIRVTFKDGTEIKA